MDVANARRVGAFDQALLRERCLSADARENPSGIAWSGDEHPGERRTTVAPRAASRPSSLSSDSSFQRPQNLARRVPSRQAGDGTARVRPGAAQEQAVDGGPILRPSQRRPHAEQLIDGLLAVMDVPARQPIGLFEVDWCQHLAMFNRVRDAWRVSLQRAHTVVAS